MKGVSSVNVHRNSLRQHAKRTSTHENNRGDVQVFAAIDEVPQRIAFRLWNHSASEPNFIFDENVGVEGDDRIDDVGDELHLRCHKSTRREATTHVRRKNHGEHARIYYRTLFSY